MTSERTKACEFSKSVREVIHKRDKGRCIVCGTTTALTFAHYLSRSKGGVGVEKNGVRMCMNCHHRMDHTIERPMMLAFTRNYLQSKYEDWNEEELKYRKVYKRDRRYECNRVIRGN